MHPVVHQLGQILVGADDPDRRVCRSPGDGGDEIIRFKLRLLQQRPAERLRHGPDRRNLGTERIRHRRPVRLVFRIEFQPESHLAAVEEHRSPFCRVVLLDMEQQAGEDEKRIGRFPPRVGQHADGEEGAENLAVGVDQDHFVGHGGFSGRTLLIKRASSFSRWG